MNEPFRLLSDEEINALVRGYTDTRLAVNYRHASEQPDTVWCRLLAAEILRRGMEVPG